MPRIYFLCALISLCLMLIMPSAYNHERKDVGGGWSEALYILQRVCHCLVRYSYTSENEGTGSSAMTLYILHCDVFIPQCNRVECAVWNSLILACLQRSRGLVNVLVLVRVSRHLWRERFHSENSVKLLFKDYPKRQTKIAWKRGCP